MERDAYPRAVFYISLGHLMKKDLLIKIKTHLSMSPVKEHSSLFPDGARMERDAPF
jgi:hypothetical protein